ncbi:hypothetical protein LSCM4_02154 [Leishmania orientalis]|uniref:C2H2-type domain-containing protein n=1 Tax=Leishmania orientalis TaxID=2249476 RepID=A0A836GVU5_9TRYP|nr:hypothetical protein LSCM4_02154 [Leishmania orientalis]
MPFRFRLYNPPCDVTFLSLVDGEALYNADSARTRDVKEATIRQLGWHRVELPPDWFLSREALDTIRQLLEAMQCTVQYLKYCGKNEERRAQRATAELRRCEEERAAAFEELIELRELLASYKRQLRELGEERQRARSPRWGATLAGNEWASRLRETEGPARQLPCCFCANVYPSRHALESHMRKRHKRSDVYAAVAATSAVGSVKQRKKQEHLEAATQAPVFAHQASLGFLCGGDVPPVLQKADDRCGDRFLQEQISELRLAVAKLTEQQAELYRSISPSHLAAASQQCTGKAVTAANPLSAGEPATADVAVASTGPLPGLSPRNSKPNEEDLLLCIHRELLHTSTQLQQLQSAVDKESAQHGKSAADDRDSSNVREELTHSQQRHQSLDPVAAPLGTCAAPTLDPQTVLYPPSCTERGDIGAAARQRRSDGDSLVIVSPITPPASVTAEPHQVHGSRADATAALEQKRVQAVPPTASESLCGTNSGLGSFIEAQRPPSVLGNMSVSTTSALGLPFSGRSGDSASVAHRHGVPTPKPAPYGLLRKSGTSTGDRSPTSLSAAINEGYGKQTAPRETEAPERVLPNFSFQSHLPWMGGESATVHLGTTDLMPANRYSSAATEGATPWPRGHLSPSPEHKAQTPPIVFPGFARADAPPSSHLTPAEVTTNDTSTLIAATSAGVPERCSSLEGSAATAPVESCQRFGGITQLGVTEFGSLRIVPSQREVAPSEGLSRAHLPPHQQTPPMPHIMPLPPPKVPGSAVADADRPTCSTSPLISRSTQRVHAEAPDRAAVSAAMSMDRSHGDLSETLPNRSQAPIERFQQALADTGQVAGGSTQKSIPVVHLVPQALSESGKLPRQDSQKKKRDDLPGEATASSVVLLPSPLGLNDSFQQHTQPQGHQRRRGDEDGSESKDGAKNAGPYSIGMPRVEALEQYGEGVGRFSVPVDTTVRVGRNVGTTVPGDPVMEDVQGDALAEVTSYAAERDHVTRPATFAAPSEGGNVDTSRFARHNSEDAMVGGERTPSQADPQTFDPVSSEYYYYTYSYSDEEGAASAEEGTAAQLHADDGGQEKQRASAFPTRSVAGLSESASRTDVTPVRHTAEGLPSREADARHGNAGEALSEKRKASRHNLKNGARRPADQQAAPPQQQQPPARGHRGVKEASDELVNVPGRPSSRRSTSAPQQALRKTKGFFTKLFSKKDR